jgi:hypothetical protein
MVMKIAMRQFVTFKTTTFPDDAEWNDNDDLLVPGGRLVSKAICDLLSGAGFKVSEPRQHSFYGWSFEVIFLDRVEWFLIQGGEPWLLLVEEHSSLWRRIFGRGHLQEILDVLHKVLQQDQRFCEVQWFTESEYRSGAKSGHRTP